MTEFPPDPETYEIIGAAMEVHKALGPGFLEAVYHEALILELADRGLMLQSQVPISIQYKGRTLHHQYRADLIVGGGILVELKAHSGLGDADVAQIVHYLKATELGRGLLFNFGFPSLQYRRFVWGDAWKSELVKPGESVLQGGAPAPA